MGFKEEFEKARRAGKETFKYKGKSFNTLREGETKKEWKEKLAVPTKYRSSSKKKIEYPENEKNDSELREEVKAFVEDFNKKEKTSFSVSKDKGAEHRHKGQFGRKTINHVEFGGTDYTIKGGNRKKQDKLLKFMAGAGFRSIDERKAKGKHGDRNIVHFDANTLDRGGQKKAGPRGQRFREDKKGRYASQGVEKQVFQNEMLTEQKEEMRKLAALEKNRKSGLLAEIQSAIPQALGQEKQSKEVATVGTPASMEKPIEAVAKTYAAPKDVVDPEVEALEDMERQYVYEEAQREFPLMDTGKRYAMRQRGDEGAIENKSFGQLLSKKKREEEEEELIPEGGVPVVLNDEEKAQLKAEAPTFSTPQGTTVVASPDIDNTQVAEMKKVASHAPVEEERGLSDDFKDALSFFAPALVGGAIGAIFEGGAGAQAGIEQGHTLGQAFRKHKDTQEDRKLRRDIASVKAGKKDIGTFVDSSNGNPIYYDRSANKFKTIDGKEVPQNRAVHATTFRQTRRIDQTKEIEKAKQDRFMKRFGLDKAKLAQMSGEQVSELQSYNHVLDSIEEMSRLKGKVDTGIISDSVSSLLELFDKQPEGYTELKSASNDSLAKYVKSISGAQVSELEAERLGRIIPTTTDNDETFKKKLKMFKKIVQSNKSAMARALKAGQPLKSLIGLEESLKELDSKKKDKSGFSRAEIDAMKEKIRKERQGR